LKSDQPFPWYAVQVRTKGENLVRTLLERKEYEIYLPTYKEVRKYSDRMKKVDVPLFPGYVFCRMDVTERLPVLKTPGVHSILGFDGEPSPVPDEEMVAIQRVVGSGASVGPWPFLKVGDRVRVERGAFTGVEGILISERGCDRLILSVEMLQRSVAVEIDRSWIRPLKR
jgi:transcription antitermination factor NusG